jgi:hypothetical protein
MGTDEGSRIEAVRRLDLLDTPGEERFDRITRIARELFHVPVAEINFIDERRQFTKSPQLPGQPRERPRNDSFCTITIERPEILVVNDAMTDARFASHMAVTGEPHVRFYAGRPLSLGDDLRVGTLCLVGMEPRGFGDDERRLLDEMGSWVERELRDTADLDRAAEVQQSLLPTDRPSWPDYEVVGLSVPARTVGGDYYAWRGTRRAIELTVADVMGKGTAGAILAAGVRSAMAARSGDDPVRTVEAVNAQLIDDLERTDSFATLFHGRLDVATGAIDYADAGHGLTAIVHAGGAVERLAATGLPMGIVADAEWSAGQAQLAPGDTLIAFTDGLLDLYTGTLDSLEDIARLVRTGDAAADVLARIDRLVRRSSPDDDVTAVVVRRAG